MAFTRQKREYVHVIVQKKTGKIVLISGSLPIYWLAYIAKEISKGFKGTEVKKINLIELEKLIK